MCKKIQRFNWRNYENPKFNGSKPLSYNLNRPVGLEGVSHMDYLEPPGNCLDHLISIFAVELLNGVVGRDNELGVVQWYCSTLSLTSACIVI